VLWLGVVTWSRAGHWMPPLGGPNDVYIPILSVSMHVYVSSMYIPIYIGNISGGNHTFCENSSKS
jgi:hypothetical protein